MAFNGRFVLNLINIAAEKSLDKRELISITGYGESQLVDEKCKVENGAYDALNDFICAHKGFESFGLQSAEAMGLEASGIVGQITQNSTTVKQALKYCCEFANLGCSSLPMSLKAINGACRLEIIPNGNWLLSSPNSVRQTVEGMVAYTVKQFN